MTDALAMSARRGGLRVVALRPLNRLPPLRVSQILTSNLDR